MRSALLSIVSFAVTIFCWGVYGPVLHFGQEGMSDTAGMLVRWRPFICVGLAYFLIGVIVPVIWLSTRGEKGNWTATGTIWSLVAGSLGATGALGIVLAFTFGGRPIYVMPLVFGGAPVVNAFLTIYMAGKIKDIGAIFSAGLVMVILGAVIVLVFAPHAPAPSATLHTTSPVVMAQTDTGEQTTGGSTEDPSMAQRAERGIRDFVLQLLAIATTILSWGAYGPMLHKGQAAMQHSRMRPLLCVGLAYFAIAVVVPFLVLQVVDEPSYWSVDGTFWSLAAGAAGALGALGIILAFNFGGNPVYVMPLVFGGAPVVNTMFTTTSQGLWGEVNAFFLAGLILVVAGSAMVLFFAPRGKPPAKAPPPADKPDKKPAQKASSEEPKQASATAGRD